METSKGGLSAKFPVAPFEVYHRCTASNKPFEATGLLVVRDSAQMRAADFPQYASATGKGYTSSIEAHTEVCSFQGCGPGVDPKVVFQLYTRARGQAGLQSKITSQYGL